MTSLRDVLERHTGRGSAPGAVGLVARGDRAEVAAVGHADASGAVPMTRESVFRIASLTKQVTAAAAMMLVEEGRFALQDPVERWLPELASPVVVRRPDGPVDDVVPASRPITVLDLLTFRAGYGFAPDFSLPVVRRLFAELAYDPVRPQAGAAPDEWMAALSRIPLLHQPGEGWLYHFGSDILGVLIARASGTPLPEFLAERLFEPLGMEDTGFWVPPEKLGRLTSLYLPPRTPGGGIEPADPPDGQWSRRPAFPSGGGGLVSTLDDWHAFARMLLAEGRTEKGPARKGRTGRGAEGGPGGRQLLSPASVRRMTADQLTRAQREAGAHFLEGQGWGFGGGVDVDPVEVWNVPGRYGWVGGSGTAAHITPSTGAVTILLTQLRLSGPAWPERMRDFWRYAAGV
ncbi:serine hydrolase [Streptomyces abyssalis]|uniref:Serine hydrolase n=1 Tax=Streptomyces abyssalis TaxID=933944 RepID=A0A1E7JJL7_9ACTN|nr:serine hydrolase domain-containing protein [Streptomyces abyssalis]OEU87307.1 serine hydrolase [Streptomyces abyssalis]OEU87838.1 serine hydrolase [Streptomyces abyssalis]OEV30265.1 serine hydrolase [Streptomyces nanshensis]